jgi:hypothetical protein
MVLLLLQEDWINDQQEGLIRYWKEAQQNITAAGLTLRDLQHTADMVSGGRSKAVFCSAYRFQVQQDA